MSFRLNLGATFSAIEETSSALRVILNGGVVPDSLVKQWALSDGFHGDAVEFFSTSEIAERNETMEVLEFCPGYLIIASDAGSAVALVHASKAADRVFLNYGGDLSAESMVDTGMSIENWVSAGCPFSLSPKSAVSAVEQVRLQLDRVPAQGLKALVEIKKLAGLEIGLSELRDIDKKLPYILSRTSYIKALRVADKINRIDQCVSIWMERSPSVRLSLVDPFE